MGSLSQKQALCACVLVCVCIAWWRLSASAVVALQSSHSRVDCDPCAKKWVLVIAVGRSGSTTIMSMLNRVPKVSISGEDRGLAYSLVKALADSYALTSWSRMPDEQLWKWLQRIKFINSTTVGSYRRAQVEADQVICSVQDMILRTRFPQAGRLYDHVGFKDLRYKTVDELLLLKSLFPCGRFVLSYRRDIDKQSKSSFFSSESDAKQRIMDVTHEFKKFNASFPEISFPIALEEFSVSKFNDMLKFLGMTSCSFKNLLFDNAAGSFKADESGENICES